MPLAFVFINTEVGAIEDVLVTLQKFEGVEEAYAVYGVYDIAAKIKAESMEALEKVVLKRIRQISKIASTLTLIVIRS